ncbi:copper chaperone CopZ [Neobacillus niacini]|uniref:hypothetical protein n=1 Tax=Neobacillus niacini TaxID=86668 RepID=UPI0028678AA4|nr:hypothetical protein [Neobacillus niacini]MDR7079812.1 copper chaperone CopZ [Neobacillus niacini]
MGYLEQFAQNRRRKENTTVLTARLQESVYDDFKTYCDELGLYSLSISEAVCLLVKGEITGIEGNTETVASIQLAEVNTDDDQMSDDVVVTNTNVYTKNDNVVKKNKSKRKSNTVRFTTKPFQINGQLPCPICENGS